MSRNVGLSRANISAGVRVIAPDRGIVWICSKCRTEGRISNWQGSL